MAFKFKFDNESPGCLPTKIRGEKHWDGSAEAKITTPTIYAGGQSILNEGIYYAIPTTPGLHYAKGDMSYIVINAPITEKEKQAVVAAYIEQRAAANIVFGLWDTQIKEMGFGLKNDETGIATWDWYEGKKPVGVESGKQKINNVEGDLDSKYEFKKFGSTYDQVKYDPDQYYRPVVLAITGIKKSDEPDSPENPPDCPTINYPDCDICQDIVAKLKEKHKKKSKCAYVKE